MEEGKPEKQAMDFETEPVNPHDLVSSDDEIDYSVEPEFYDPKLDDVDELWVNKQRKSQNSDAVLSCPACFTTLCLDCQRHEKYVTQYRAMFVCNCTVRTDQILRQGKQEKKSKRKRRTNAGPESGSSEPKEDAQGLIYRPVCCLVCSTEVGVLDEEEVYHFFNVIPNVSEAVKQCYMMYHHVSNMKQILSTNRKSFKKACVKMISPRNNAKGFCQKWS